MSVFNSWALCAIHVSSGLWMPALLEGSIVLCFWGRQEGICVCSQICGNVEKVSQWSFFIWILSLPWAVLDLHVNVKYQRLCRIILNVPRRLCINIRFPMQALQWWKYLCTSLNQFSCLAVGQKWPSMNSGVLFSETRLRARAFEVNSFKNPCSLRGQSVWKHLFPVQSAADLSWWCIQISSPSGQAWLPLFGARGLYSIPAGMGY